MRQAGQIVDAVQEAGRIRGNLERGRIMGILREVYYNLCNDIPWMRLRTSVTIDTSSSEDGDANNLVWLPADLINILRIKGVTTTDSDDAIFFIPRDAHDIDPQEKRYRWSYEEMNMTPLVSARSGITVSVDSTTISPALSSSYVGEWIQFDGHYDFYQIASTTTLSRSFGSNANQADIGYTVRPIGQRKLGLWTPDKQAFDDQVEVFYWRYPPQIYRETDLVLIDDTLVELALKLKYLGEVLKDERAADKLRRSYADAYELAKANNPDFGPEAGNVDSKGHLFHLSGPKGRRIFKRRT